MSTRRQSLTLQLLIAMAVLGMVAYVFFPTTRPARMRADNWYDENHLAGLEAHRNQEAAALAALKMNANQQKGLKEDSNRVRAAFVILARNHDLKFIRSSIRQLEDRFNRHFNYPYVFLNDQLFTDEFKQKTSDLTKAKTYYGKIEEDMWGYPDHINQTMAAECRQSMKDQDVMYGDSESYRHMCRFQSGFFFRHHLLDSYEYYWRVEPDVQYFCNIDYDVFQMMKDNQFKYGWTLALHEYMNTIPTLWNATREFIKKYPEYINWEKESLMHWLSDDKLETYNGCHFWSNFEIGSLDFFRSERYLKFFEHLDEQGGFFYERWGDAPVHSLAVAMMLKPSEVHFFNDIGYMHNPFSHCPSEPWIQNKCWCDDKESFDWHPQSCTIRYRELQSDFSWSEAIYKNKTAPHRIKPH